jgi:hypothetical protein
MDWLVFGDDWGAHPSTTQHLMRAMPDGDRVAWLGSLGMRAPRLNRADLRRVGERLPLPRRSGTVGTPGTQQRAPTGWSVTRPQVLPWHETGLARRLNRIRLASIVTRAVAEAGVTRPALLTANPVVALYLDDLRRDTGLDIRSVGYLRLDDYRLLPGVDRSLVELAEPLMFDRSDHVFATATRLLPGASRVSGKDQHLVAQGVDVEHFGRVTVTPPAERVLGFFGLVAEWIDLELICAVADRAPDWTLEIIGPTRVSLDALATRPNIRLRGPVPYADLPGAIADWSAAWLPFRPQRRREPRQAARIPRGWVADVFHSIARGGCGAEQLLRQRRGHRL